MVVQLAQVGFNIVSKAVMQAYQEAKTGVPAGGSAVAMAGRMSLEQARSIMNLEAGSPIVKEDVLRQFDKYYAANDPEKGGSFYVQSKFFLAKEVLLAAHKAEEARRVAREAAAAAKKAPTKGSGDQLR